MRKAKNKIALITAFLVTVTFTFLAFCIVAVDTYRYDLVSNVEHPGMNTALVIVIGIAALFYELDVFCTVCLCLIKPRSAIRITLNIMANMSLLFIGAYAMLERYYVAIRRFTAWVGIAFVMFVLFRILGMLLLCYETEKQVSFLSGKER